MDHNDKEHHFRRDKLRGDPLGKDTGLFGSHRLQTSTHVATTWHLICSDVKWKVFDLDDVPVETISSSDKFTLVHAFFHAVTRHGSAATAVGVLCIGHPNRPYKNSEQAPFFGDGFCF